MSLRPGLDDPGSFHFSGRDGGGGKLVGVHVHVTPLFRAHQLHTNLHINLHTNLRLFLTGLFGSGQFSGKSDLLPPPRG